jgi:hypothetical protein
MNHRKVVEDCIAARGDLHAAARKVYLSYPTYAFLEQPDIEYEIKERIRVHFGVGFHCIQVAGSAKTGYSFHKKSDFSYDSSDLDLAIIDSALFLSLCEYIVLITKGYTNLGLFGRTRTGIGHDSIMRKNIAEHGMIRIDIMPSSPKKTLYQKYLGEISREYNRLFTNINVAVYATSYLFEVKQRGDLSRALGASL